MRHISDSEIVSVLRRGRSVEQFLGYRDGSATICWLELRPVGGSVEIWMLEVENVGSSNYLDIYSFPPVGCSFDAPRAIVSLEQAAAFCMNALGAKSGLWVNQGMAESEYADSIV